MYRLERIEKWNLSYFDAAQKVLLIEFWQEYDFTCVDGHHNRYYNTECMEPWQNSHHNAFVQEIAFKFHCPFAAIELI